MPIKACVVGATGLVGREVVKQLSADKDVEEVQVMVRRASDFNDAKVRSHVIDFDRIKESHWPTVDALYCCLGTTIKVAGSEAAFRKVDFDYVVQSARRARAAGATTLVVVSAMGAAQRSRIFYNRTKGDMEAAVASLGFTRVIIVRPSLLVGDRVEKRPGEQLAQTVMKIGNLFLPKKYQSISGEAVARAMIAKAKDGVVGVRVVESGDLQRYA